MSDMSTSDPNDFARFEDFDEDELYIELGAELLGKGLSFGPEDFGRYRAYAVKWLSEHLSEMRSTVCGTRAVITLQSTDGGDRAMEVATVADCLTALYGKPAAAVAAVILIRRGLDNLCGDQE